MPEYDFIVVGAGSVGCAVAARLCADPAARVLLLQAGGTYRTLAMEVPSSWPELLGTEAEWGYVTTPGPMPGSPSTRSARCWADRARSTRWPTSGAIAAFMTAGPAAGLPAGDSRTSCPISRRPRPPLAPLATRHWAAVTARRRSPGAGGSAAAGGARARRGAGRGRVPGHRRPQRRPAGRSGVGGPGRRRRPAGQPCRTPQPGHEDLGSASNWTNPGPKYRCGNRR